MNKPVDAYVMFGTTKEFGGPNNTPLPWIEGDSEDSRHFYWCEIRDGGELRLRFEREAGEAGEAARPGPRCGAFEPVGLSKKVDWATTQLFQRCCTAHAAKLTDPVEESQRQTVWLDKVIVHICRPDPVLTKVTFLELTYTEVRITDFSISMSGGAVEPTEEVTFEFKDVTFSFYPVDPLTGLLAPKPERTLVLHNSKADVTDPDARHPLGRGGTSSVANGSGGGSAAGEGSTGGVQQPPSWNSSPVTSPGAANFPGSFPTSGVGTLD